MGCPNGCSQHHIANIGFYGASIKVGDKTIPASIPHIGGRYEGGEVIFGARLRLRLPSKRVPEAVERWVRFYESDRNEGEEFNAFAERVGTKAFEEQVRDLAMPAEFNLENMNLFIDWNKNIPFVVERGEGSARYSKFHVSVLSAIGGTCACCTASRLSSTATASSSTASRSRTGPSSAA